MADAETNTLFCFGLGYTALALARRKQAQGWRVLGTVRSPERVAALRQDGVDAVVFDGSGPSAQVTAALAGVTHVLASIPSRDGGDPVLAHHAADLERAPRLAWLGYLSTIGVYGDRGGAWVDEDTEPTREGRAVARLEAEAGWMAVGRASDAPAHVFRLGGIYGPGRNVLVSVAEGTARRVIKPGQVFNRIHVEDIAATLEASMGKPRAGRVYNVVDDEPSPPHHPVEHAAALLGVSLPPAVPFDEAELSPMGRVFYEANRRVRNERIKAELGVRLAYPNYRSGLDALYRTFERSAETQPSE